MRDRGLRATHARVLVYDLLKAKGGHHSADDVLGILVDDGHDLPRMTVYNVVHDLTSAGLLMCADAGPGRALYEANDTWHHHFVCRSCGRIEDVPCAVGKKPCLKAPESLDATIDEAQVIFRGLCAACTRRTT